MDFFEVKISVFFCFGGEEGGYSHPFARKYERLQWNKVSSLVPG